MKISCVVDNRSPFKSKFYSEHGFSLLIQEDENKILFDAGSSPEILKHNLNLLDSYDDLDRVVISHGHFDHTGGLPHLLSLEDVPIMLHPDAFIPKFNLNHSTPKFKGMPSDLKENKSKFQLVSETTRIGDKVWILGDITQNNPLETIATSYQVKKDGEFLKDDFRDELALVIKTDEGLVVISGCAHLGILNTVNKAMDYFQEELYGVIGGAHLVKAPPMRIKKTVEELKKLDPGIIALGHCTGFKNVCHFHKEFEDVFIPLGSGLSIPL
jgi:7,8-dihydropterin-6-yl-methyl-4-(beta-D-ribofuranosyl)aminobenzene 5'-phosphate synthase